MFQILAVIGAVIVGAFVLVPLCLGKAKLDKKVEEAEESRYTKFALGDLVELTEDAGEMLGLELVEEFGKGSFEVMAIGEADEMVKHIHPQFLLLRKRRDLMLVRKNGVNVKFCGAHLRKKKVSDSTKSAKGTRVVLPRI